MRFTAGTRLGPYQVTSLLGEGGMGEVYRCVDLRLNRTVALKALAANLLADPEILERFQREATVLSRLDHPNICAVHDVGEADGVAYVVMPFLEGQTLEAWIATSRPKGREAVQRALEIGLGIADALDHAHGRGVVHRDLKPANVILTSQGLKLLDFGIAKLITSDDERNLTRGASTRVGQVLGTPAYMAPEQLSGDAVDARSDVWAFGAVLFELLTGRRYVDAVPGRTGLEDSDLAVDDGDKRLARLRHVLARCLSPAPADRWHSGHDLALELRWLTTAPTLAAKVQPATSSWVKSLGAIAAAAAIGALAMFGISSSRQPQVAEPLPQRFSLLLSNTAPFTVGGLPNGIAITRDGSAIAHIVWNNGRAGLLHYRPFGQAQSKPLVGTEGAVAPFFSPDGQWIGFLVGRRIRKVSVQGGGAVDIATVGDRPGQATWLADDRIVVPDANGLTEVAVGGGSARVIVPLDTASGDEAFNSPTYVPDRKTFVFAVKHANSSWTNATIVAHQLESQKRVVLVEGGFAPRVVAGRHLIFGRGGNLLAATLDSSATQLMRAPVPVVDGGSSSTQFGWSQAAISDAGTLVYVAPAARTLGRLVWVDRAGAVESAHAAARLFEHPRLSPDGKRFVVGVRDGTGIDVWLGSIGGRDLERVSLNPGEDESPVWHPDGRRVAYASGRDGRRFTFLKELSGSGSEQLLADHGSWHHHLGAWSKDGQHLTLAAAESSGLPWLPHVLNLRSPVSIVRQSQEPHSLQSTSFSPDGRWLAYSSDESGRPEIYVSPADDLSARRQVTSEGGTTPLWSRAGDEIFFQRGDRMFTAAVATEPQFLVLRTGPLFDGVFDEIYWGERNYDVTADGRRFLMVRPEGGRPVAELRVILNWLSELRSRLSE